MGRRACLCYNLRLHEDLPRGPRHARHPARRGGALAARGGAAREHLARSASARSARRSSRRPSCSRAASAAPTTSCARRCTPSPPATTADAAAREHGPGGARLHRARPVPHRDHGTRSGSTTSGRCSGTSGRRRVASASSTRSASRSSGRASPWPTPRRSRWSGRSSARLGIAGLALVLNSVGDATCRPALPRGAARVARAAPARSCARTATGARREPPARLRLQGRGGPRAARRTRPACSTSCATPAASTSTRCRACCGRSASRSRWTRGWCAASTTTAHGVRDRPRGLGGAERPAGRRPLRRARGGARRPGRARVRLGAGHRAPDAPPARGTAGPPPATAWPSWPWARGVRGRRRARPGACARRASPR